MAKIQHLYSQVSGNVPSALARGQLGINIPDQTIYAAKPDGTIAAVSKGTAGVANASSLTNLHIPVQYFPVAQVAPGYTQAQLAAKFSDNGTTASLQTIPVFVFGQLWYVPPLSCPSSTATNKAYSIKLFTATRVVTLQAYDPSSGILGQSSGSLDYTNQVAELVFYSEAANIQPWFYLSNSQGTGGADATVPVYRVSNVKTFGAIPVSVGFPGAAATSYWGT